MVWHLTLPRRLSSTSSSRHLLPNRQAGNRHHQSTTTTRSTRATHNSCNDPRKRTTLPSKRTETQNTTTMSHLLAKGGGGGAKEQQTISGGSTSSSREGLRYPTNGKTIYHRPLNRSKTAELSQASFAYLFSEMVSYAQKRVTGIQELEKRLNLQGHPIGLKLLDLLLIREPPRSQTRPLNIISLLHFIKINVWQHLFGRQADRLEKSSNADTPDEYMIIDNEPLVNAYISVPKEMSQLNCAAYVAGIIEGVCDGGGFPARVTAHTVGGKEEGEMWPGKTVFLVKFQGEVLEREALIGKG